MKKLVILLLLSPLLLLLTGCPYNSKVPLSAVPKIPIDKSLLGTWKSFDDKDSTEMKVLEFNSKEYYVYIRSVSKGALEVDHYRAYISVVGKEKIVNFEDLKQKGEFNFFRYKQEGDKIKVQVVSDVAVKDKYASPKSMTKAFSKKINEKDFFESELVFVRKK